MALARILAILIWGAFSALLILMGIAQVVSDRYDPRIPIEIFRANGLMAFDGYQRPILLIIALSVILWLVLNIVTFRILQLFRNRRIDLHGSAHWLTRHELKRMGMLTSRFGKGGVVLGQTADARFREIPPKRPRRKKGESDADWRLRKEQFDPTQKEMVMTRPGDLIVQNKNAHTLIIGSTRSGKGVSVIIPTEFRWPESMIAFDPKGEGWDIASSWRSNFSYTMKFEPEKPNESIHYNPLLAIRRGNHTIPDIMNLATILIPSNPQAKDPFWDDEGRRLFTAVCGYVVLCEPPERKTFAQIYSVFTNEETIQNANGSDDDDEDMNIIQRYLRHYADVAKEQIETNGIPDDLRRRYEKAKGSKKAELEIEIRKYLSDDDKKNLERVRQDLIYFSSCEQKQLSSVVSVMMSKLQVIADPNVQAITDRSDFTIEDFSNGIKDEKGIRRPMSLYLIVSLASMKRLIPLVKIFYSQAITLMTRSAEKKRFRTLMILDEFPRMERMDIIDDALSLSAGYGVLLLVAIQSFDQLADLYGKPGKLIDNFAYQVVLRLNDASTAAEIEKKLGQATVRRKSTSFSGNPSAIVSNHESTSVQDVGRSLMTAAEILTMDENDCIVIQSGKSPYYAKKNRYYIDPDFQKMYMKGTLRKHKMSPPLVEDEYPHPDTVDENGKRIGLDSEGWHLLSPYSSERAEIEDAIEDSRTERKEIAPSMLSKDSKAFEDDAREEDAEERQSAPSPRVSTEIDGDTIKRSEGAF